MTDSQSPTPEAGPQDQNTPPKAPAPETAQPQRTQAKAYAGPARFRLRHFLLILSFLVMVAAPLGGIIWYLHTQAADQYASHLGFSVQEENKSTPLDIIGGNIGTANSAASTDILFEYIQSQELIEKIDNDIDLKARFSRPEQDFYFRFDPKGSIEDLVEYWPRMVKIFYDNGTGLIQVRVLAFTPEDAQDIASAVLENSANRINELSATPLNDQTRTAKEELNRAVDRRKEATLALEAFRREHRLVDPNVDLTQQMGLLGSLQEQLATSLIELDLLTQSARQNDPRIKQEQRKIDVIRARISEEREKLGLSQLIGRFEELKVDLKFADESYVAALAAYDTALADARRKSSYLAAFVRPTKAETSQYPKRITLIALSALFLFLAWFTAILIGYSVRDRR